MTVRPRSSDSTSRRVPAEWEPQRGVQLTWPHIHSDWGSILNAVEETFATITRCISFREEVLIGAADPAHARNVLSESAVNLPNVHVYRVPSNDTWVRDHGPITIYENDTPTLLNFRFNGWGGKFPAQEDNLVTSRLHEQGAYGKTRLSTNDFVLEGGALDSDGAGTLLTTSQCLLNPNRNGQLTQEPIERTLYRHFGLNRVLWLHHGYLLGDDTDSHVDTLARFCDQSTIAYVSCTDQDDEHYEALTAMEAELSAFRRLDGSPYRLIPLPLPTACYDDRGERLPATYANFLIINGAVLIPTYDVPEDEAALTVLAECFPSREIVGVPCRTLITQHGSLHCVTMQLPEGVAL